MLNKILALLLSAGLLLSPLNTADSPSAASGELTANVAVTVGKEQGVWEKYSVSTAPYKGYKLVFQGSSQGSAVSTGSWDYSFDRRTGAITFNNIVNISREQSCTFYAHTGIGDISRIVQNWNESTNTLSQRAFAGVVSSATITEEVKGDFIANITADVGSLPQDGVHMDGYWYVFKNLVED